MAAASSPRKTRKAEPKAAKAEQVPAKTKYIAGIGLAVIILAIAGALFYGLQPSQPSSIGAFQASFLSANTIGIYVGDFNATGYPPADGCANNLIETAVANAQHHRAPGSINFFVVNTTSCSYSHGLGGTVNTSVINVTQCLGFSATEPSIFINYSTTNSTLVRDGVLYISGTLKFLSECGIASEIYST